MEKYVSTAWLSSKLRDVKFLEARNLDEPFIILHALGVLWNDIESAPAADVVPKSEVERLQEALSKAEADVKNYIKVAEYQQSLSVKRYHEIKRLKEDIERLEDINERDVENLRLAKAEVAREIVGIIDNRMELKTEQCKGIHNEIVLNVYRGQYDAYRDIKEIIEQKYTEVAE